MEVTKFVFEIRATEEKLKGVFKGLLCCHDDLLRHNDDRIVFSSKWSFIWYHNIASTTFISMKTPFDFNYQKLSSFSCLILIKAIVIFTPLEIQNSNKKRKSNCILVVVVK